MKILPHKLATTNGQSASRAGLPTIAQLMQQLGLDEPIDQQFPLPKSNRGFKPSQYLEAWILMQHGGSFHLDDVRHLHDEECLRRNDKVLCIGFEIGKVWKVLLRWLPNVENGNPTPVFIGRLAGRNPDPIGQATRG